MWSFSGIQSRSSLQGNGRPVVASQWSPLGTSHWFLLFHPVFMWCVMGVLQPCILPGRSFSFSSLSLRTGDTFFMNVSLQHSWILKQTLSPPSPALYSPLVHFIFSICAKSPCNKLWRKASWFHLLSVFFLYQLVPAIIYYKSNLYREIFCLCCSLVPPQGLEWCSEY